MIPLVCSDNIMSIEKLLKSRADHKCELCTGVESLSPYKLPPREEEDISNYVLVCSTCSTQLADQDALDGNHWRCLNDSMWSEVPAVKVVVWRLLNALKSEGWSQDLIEMMYMEDETIAWAKSGLHDPDAVKHVDSNGAVLEAGDSVVLIKDLNVKGASFVAKRGTAVRRISLVHDNPEHIEGKINGQHIVILTQYVKKSPNK